MLEKQATSCSFNAAGRQSEADAPIACKTEPRFYGGATALSKLGVVAFCPPEIRDGRL